MKTYIPADLLEYIEQECDGTDYALYVLDGQTADHSDDEDDWHDVVVVAERGYLMSPLVTKFTMDPSGSITQYTLSGETKC